MTKTDPLVTDERLLPSTVVAFRYDKDGEGNPVGDRPRKQQTTIPGLSAKDVRDIYEKDRAALLKERDALIAILSLLPIEEFNPDGEDADAADFPDNARHFVAAMDAARTFLSTLNTPKE